MNSYQKALELYNEIRRLDRESENYIEHDYTEIIELLNESAKYEYLPAIDMLGDFYYFGKGVKIDKDLSFRYWNRAAENGYNLSMLSIGRYYDFDKKDKKTANKWYKKGSKNGCYLCTV